MTDYTTCTASAVGRMLPNIYVLGYRLGQSLGELMEYIQVTYFVNHAALVDSATTTTSSSSSTSFWTFITTFPALYKEWWINLYSNDPTHVYVETTLLIAIVYFLVNRRSNSDNWKDRAKAEKLSLAEEEELLQEWKDRIRQPLAPLSSLDDIRSRNNSHHPNNNNNPRNKSDHEIVVHKNNSRLFEIEIAGGNERKTVLNFATFDFLGMGGDDPIALAGGSTSDTGSLTDSESNNTTNDGTHSTQQPPPVPLDSAPTDPLIIISPERPELIQNTVKQAALRALDRYGCGSCGPRGFYGTVDVHLQLEEKFANFMQTDNAILYSDAASTISSTIAAFCKRGDLLVVDEACYEPIMTGVLLSRANVKWFKHNDMDDLRAVMAKAHESDVKLGRKANAQRRFIVVEGLYKNTGAICPLDEVVKLKHQYHYRVILDESYSFGTLGPTGKGCIELYNQEIMTDAEIVTISIENAIGSIGGMTIGTDEVVDHQRLCGAGYCFSASSPPFTAAAAIEALNIMENHRVGIVRRLNANRDYMYTQLSAMLSSEMDDLLLITSDVRSPIIMLQLADNTPDTDYIDENAFLHEIATECLHTSNIALVATGSSTSDSWTTAAAAMNSSHRISAGPSKSSSSNKKQPAVAATGVLQYEVPPRIRITVTATHTLQDIDRVVIALRDAMEAVRHRYCSYEDNDLPPHDNTNSTMMNATSASS